MEYIKVDEHLEEHPKVLAIPRAERPAAMWLWLRGMCYCSRRESDGAIPCGFADGEEQQAAALVACGLWLDAEGGWQVADYLDYNRSREEIEAIREERRAAGRRGGLAKAKQSASKVLANSKQTPSKSEAKVYPETETETKTETERETRAKSRTLPACLTESVSGQSFGDDTIGWHATPARALWAAVESARGSVVSDRDRATFAEIVGKCPECVGEARCLPVLLKAASKSGGKPSPLFARIVEEDR